MIKPKAPFLGQIAIIVVATLLTSTAAAQMPHHRTSRPAEGSSGEHKGHTCSLRTIAGHWGVITDVLHGDDGSVQGATVGIMNLPGDGTLNGVYDREGLDGFHPNIAYAGTVTVNPDCTGTMEWADTGSSLTLKASITIGDDGQEIRGVFQDPTLIIGSFRERRTDAHHCSIKNITGTYASTTDLLYMISGNIDGYAIGTATFKKDGTSEQLLDIESTSGFFPGVASEGTVTVNPNCTGTASFHEVGDTTIIGQSFVVVEGGREIWAMFQDPTIDIGTERGVRVKDNKGHDHDH